MRTESRLRGWALRAIAAFLVVFILGSPGVPTQVLSIAAVIAVIIDGVRLVLQGRADESKSGSDQKRARRETIH